MSRDDDDANDWVSVNKYGRKLVTCHMLNYKETHLYFW
jgi:hypothetical protein